MKPILLALIFFLFLTSAPAQPEMRGTAADFAAILTNVHRFVQISGKSEVKVQADKAIITLKIITAARDLGQALRANQAARNKFIALLETKQIVNQVRASKFSSTEKFGMFSDKAKSHKVTNLLKVSVQTEKDFQIVADTIDSMSEAQFVSVDFDYTKEAEAKATAIAEACKDAGMRKVAYEDALGLKLTVRRFADQPAGRSLSQPTQAFGFAGLGGTAPSLNGYVASASSDEILTPALARSDAEEAGFGQLIFRAQVAIEYTAENK